MFESWSLSETHARERRVFAVAQALKTFQTLQVDQVFLAKYTDIKTFEAKNVFPRQLSGEEIKCIQYVFKNRGFHVSLPIYVDRTDLRLLSSAPEPTLSTEELPEDDILTQTTDIEILPISTWLQKAEEYAIKDIFRRLRDHVASEQNAIFDFFVRLPSDYGELNKAYRTELFKRAFRWVGATTCYDAMLAQHHLKNLTVTSIKFVYKTHRGELQRARLNAKALLFLSLWSVKRRQGMETSNEPKEEQDGLSLGIADEENGTNVCDWARMPVVLGKKIVHFLVGVDIGVMGEVRRL